jgi:chromosome segregation ATPase
MRYFSILLIFILLAGCSDKQKMSALIQENMELKNKYAELDDQAKQKEVFIEEFTTTLNEVYDNLEKIREKESLIGKFSQNIEENRNVSLKDKILDNIQSIEAYLDNSKKQLNKFKSENYQNLLKRTDLEKTLENLTKMVDEKEQEITQLKEQISQLNIRLTSYVDSLSESKEIINRQTEKINTVYYVIGTEKELKENGIIEEKGGILGIRKTKTLAADFNEALFEKADVSEMEKLTINRNLERIKIISPHNPDSYQLLNVTEDQTLLDITNPEDFWKIQYLVILTKG